MKNKILFILALLCAMVQGALAQDNWDAVYRMTQTTSANWTALNAGSNTGRTLGSEGNATYYYLTSNLSFTNSNVGGSGLTIKGSVFLYVPTGMTLTCTGANANGTTGAGAGIELTSGNMLYLLGNGTLNATGGNAANGGNGGNGSGASGSYSDELVYPGNGGAGGNGGGGAGAGIGTRGGNGGAGGSGGVTGTIGYEVDQNGGPGGIGAAGATASAMGKIYVFQTAGITVNATGGSKGTANGHGGSAGGHFLLDFASNQSVAGGAGGGGGGFGGAASNIGTGGPGGGGGGGGSGGSTRYKHNPGYYRVGSTGGGTGMDGDGSWHPDDFGASTEMTGTQYFNDDSFSDEGYDNGSGAPAYADGGVRGNASTSGSINTVSEADWTTQEDDWDLICLLTKSKRTDWIHLTDDATTGKTLGSAGTTTYYYTAYDRTFTNVNAGGSGLTIKGTVYLYIPSRKNITCIGANASGTTGAGAGIELTAGNKLYLIGSGNLTAKGGNAANGSNGTDGGNAVKIGNMIFASGLGGDGGAGGGGAGAGIGTRGGNGGTGGAGGYHKRMDGRQDCDGEPGGNGSAGTSADAMGDYYVYQTGIMINATGGSKGTVNGHGGSAGSPYLYDASAYNYTVSGGAGGGGGGFGGAASNIGTGGPGGGGGGGGSSGSCRYKHDPGYYRVGATGGGTGMDGDGSWHPDDFGASTEITGDQKFITGSGNGSTVSDHGYENGSGAPTYADGGVRGNATTSISPTNLAVLWPTQGIGTEENPYLISSTDDWNNFAISVNGGHPFSGRFVNLASNISVETMVGTDYTNSFQGTFEGDGNTLTVNYNATENNAAPFSHVRNATIKNLHVAGTINTSAPFAGGIVSESHASLTLTGCVSSVAINSSKEGDGTHGGLVSTLSGSYTTNTIIIEGCVFDGSFATTAGTVGCGCFIGWGVYNKPVIKNSLLKPSSVDADMLGSNFARWHTGDGGIYEPTFTKCYYVATDNLPTDQGTQAYAQPSVPANLGDPVHDYGMMAFYDKGILYDGTFYAYGDEEGDGIEAIENGEVKNDNKTDVWYTLDGRKLIGKPTQCGIYINNGNKVVIK